MRPRTILIAAAGASLTLLLVRWPWAGRAAPAASPPAPVAAREAALPLRDGTADRVRGELAELRADVSRLGAARTPREERSPEEAQARHEQRAAAQSAALAKVFAADTRDPSWSPQTERGLHDAFAAAALPGVRLEEVTCGARLCRFTAAFDSIARRDDGMGALFTLVRWRSLMFGDASPDEPLRYIVYAARDQESFPRID